VLSLILRNLVPVVSMTQNKEKTNDMNCVDTVRIVLQTSQCCGAMARDDDCRSHTLVAVTRTVVFLSLVGIVLLAPVWATSGAGLVPNGGMVDTCWRSSVTVSE
jgi:hypothetical protein